MNAPEIHATHLFWILKNYEYLEGASVKACSILDLASNAGLSVGSVTLGQCVSKIWKTKVKITRRDTLKELYYENLALRSRDWEPISELNITTLQKVNVVCQKHPGWFVAFSSFDDQRVVLMKEQTKDVRVDTRRLAYQITVDLGLEEDIKLSTYGEELSMSHSFTLNDTHVSCSAIDVAISYVETATPCLGQPISNTNESLKVSVPNSKVITLTTPATVSIQNETRLVSLACNFLSYSCPNSTTNVISCHECSSVYRLFKKRECKRKKAMATGSQKAPHSNCNQIYLSRKGLEMKVKNQKEKMKKEFKRLREEDCIEFVDDDHADLVKIVNTIETKDMSPEMKLLWEIQMKQLSVKSANGHRWDPRIVRLALDIYCKSPKALDSLREYIILPSNRLIRYYKNSVEQKPGWNSEVIAWCKQEAERQHLKEQDYWGGLVLDEMKIQEDLQMTVKDGRHQLTGIVSLGQFHDAMENIKSGQSSVNLATHLLQFIFLSDCGFRFPLAHFPTTTCPPSTLYLQFWEGVMQLKRAGFTIYHAICDGGDANRQFINIHFPDDNPRDLHFTGNNLFTKDPMIFIMDCKHNIKKLRNNIEKSSPRGKRQLEKDGKKIMWSHWEEAYCWDQNNNSCPVHEHLTEEHFHLTPSSRMRNALAEDVLDKRMLLLMQAYRDHLGTIEEDPGRLDMSITLLKHTSNIVELFSDKHAVYHVNDNRLRALNDSLTFFTEWKQQTTISKQFVSAKLWFDMQSMVLGFTSMVREKLSRFPGSMIKPAIVNQDLVENHFSQLRGANGQNENPAYQLTQGTQNSIIFGQSIVSKKSNTGGLQSNSFVGLPNKSLFGKNKKPKLAATAGLLIKGSEDSYSL